MLVHTMLVKLQLIHSKQREVTSVLNLDANQTNIPSSLTKQILQKGSFEKGVEA